ncbi:hypothetical protein GCU56_10150 [Geodermatophilus sabuli]|uniref:Uncharacterized protein n=1 Tax=Geodermatophilus sabuli TaxID=1564158 RepID=A0A7K3W016_9ACTN|nr:hypothetical protein [Geodermatophilus sabuli]NEK58231.1 hypothetical protein [Geodermatophilus sabuli]
MTSSARDRDSVRRDPDTGGRPLADILREAGVESPARGRRRRPGETGDAPIRQRGDVGETGDTGIRRRGADGGRMSDTGRAGLPSGRRAADRTGDLAPPAPSPDRRRGRPEPSTAAIPGLRPSRKPGVPGATSTTGVLAGAADTGAVRAGTGRARTSDAGPSTGPIPVVRADADTPLLEDEALGAQEGALAWLRFAGELVVALAAGVGIYFLFTVLWELLPYLAVLLAPVAVAALVAGVGAWRQRQDKEHIGARLTAVLVFAGTLLTIAPAAGLLAGG